MRAPGAVAVVLSLVLLPLVPPAAAVAQEGGQEDREITRYVRYVQAGDTAYGILEGETIRVLDGNFIEGAESTDRTVARSDVRLLAPVDPGKIIGVILNYHPPDEPASPIPVEQLMQPRWLFGKLPTSVAGPGEPIPLPPESDNLDWEAEMGVVIGKRARHVTVSEAMDYVFGFTVVNDVSENTWYQDAILFGKAGDNWAPMGPVVARGVDWNDLMVRAWVNGQLVNEQSTAMMRFTVPYLISYLSRYYTLEPGDVINTGSVAFLDDIPSSMSAGDVVEVEIEDIGRLRNRVEEMPPPPSWEEPEPTSPTGPVTTYVRYRRGGEVSYGIREGETIHELRGDIFGEAARTGRTHRVSDVALLPPTDPEKILGIVANFFPPDSAGGDAPIEEFRPRPFLKWPTVTSGPGDPIMMPPESTNLDWEGELVVIIGREAKHVTPDEAMDYVFGYTVGNDVSENDWGGLQGKAMDTWAAFGPNLVSGLDWRELCLEVRVNGRRVQGQCMEDMRYSVPLAVSYFSRHITLEPGDAIYMGTVARTEDTPSRMRPGDVMQVEIPEIGTLWNVARVMRPHEQMHMRHMEMPQRD